MLETFATKNDNIEIDELTKETAADKELESFFDKEAEILASYGMKGDITIQKGEVPGHTWAFDYTHQKLIYDPKFFTERGYTLKEALFATTHELMAHYGEFLREPELMLKEWHEDRGRLRSRPHLRLLHNIFEDVLGNRRIVAELPFLEETKTTLYKEKQFPKTDYRDNALHVQFVYGFIREAMVPEEDAQVDEKIRQIYEKLRNFGKDKIDILDLVTTPTIDTKDRLRIMKNIVEPIYMDLYEKDVEEEKKSGKSGKPKKSGEGEEKNKQEFSSAGKKGSNDRAIREAIEKKFKEQYKDYEKTHPEPLSVKDEENLKKAIEEIGGRKGGEPSLDKKILEEWAKEHGIDAEDVLGYREEYKEIAPLVAELREIFKKIVARRLRVRMKLSPQLEEKGEELEEGILTEAYVESKTGGKPRAFHEIEARTKEEPSYGALDMTLINDLSGSMTEGSKLDMDRKSKLLFLESLADFQKEIEEAEYESGVSLGFQVRTETRAFGDFGDAELKPLSPTLSEKDRIAVWKKLHKASGGTPDFLSLEKVLNSITPEDERALREKSRRKVVVVFSDGDSQDSNRVQIVLKKLREKGVITLGLGMTESGVAVKETYKPDAEVIEDIKKLPGAVQKVILKYTEDL